MRNWFNVSLAALAVMTLPFSTILAIIFDETPTIVFDVAGSLVILSIGGVFLIANAASGKRLRRMVSMRNNLLLKRLEFFNHIRRQH